MRKEAREAQAHKGHRAFRVSKERLVLRVSKERRAFRATKAYPLLTMLTQSAP